jgi:hypothetical protein
LDGNENILHHTVNGSEESKARKKERGITWPARYLAREIGPRAPGSQGERSASHFIAKELKGLGLAAEAQEYRTPATTAWSEMLVYLIPVIGVLLFPANSHISYGLIVLGFLFFLLESYGRSPFSCLQPYRRSQNVLARIKPQRDPGKTLVVIAHMDSPRSAFYYRPGFVHLLRAAYLLDFACIAAIFMLFMVAYAGDLLNMERSTLDLFWQLGLALAIPPALTVIALLFKAAAGLPTPGGNDNASGVAVLLGLAGVYTRRRPYDTDLWLVSTGASDAGGVGLKRLLRRYRRELKGAYFIVMDGMGRGFPVVYRREGRLISFRANRKLTGLAGRVNDVHARRGPGYKRNSMYISEGFRLLSRGRKAITLSSREESRYPRHWRWIKDDYDNIDPRSLRLSLDFAIAMVDGIDRGDLKQ